MSNLSHKFKNEHADKTLFVPGGQPSKTVDAESLTQDHIDAFDEETKDYFFEKSAPVEITFPTADELKADIEKLQKKLDESTEQYKSSRHGKNLEEKIMGLMLQLEAMEKQSAQD